MRRSGREGGASLLELAIIAPILAMIVMSVFDLGLAYRKQITLDGAAREGAAFAQHRPNDVDCAGDDDIVGRVAAANPDLVGLEGYAVVVLAEDSAGNLTVPVTGCGGGEVEVGERVKIEIEADHEITTPLVASVVGGSLPMRGDTEVEVIG